MPTANADQNLLFGFIALHNGLLSREDLIAATSVWLQDKSKPLDQVLLDRGLLSPDDHKMLVPLVERHLATHEGDAEKSIAAIDAVSSVREELQRLGDEDVEASLVQVSKKREGRDEVTRTIAWGPTSPGTRYQILRPHAKGGLGLVSVALDEELKREVAFKEIQEEYADDEDGRARFVREAEITGGLEHPGIVPVYGLGQYEDGRPYYAMRLVKGRNLRDAIEEFHKAGELQSSEAALAFRQLLGQFVDVCNAIEYAHSRGILHRDIKPANVMLGKYGETLVVDWGLAKAIGRSDEQRSHSEETLKPMSGGDSSRTRMGSAIGTPSFMSPEQAAGRLDDLSSTSDVYSLGATLYCILTGQPPLHETDAGTAIRKAQTGDFPRPRDINRDIPPALETICLKAMALEPKDRYTSSAAVSADIERWLGDEPTSAHRDSLVERTARFTRRHRSWVQAGATAALLVMVCLVTAVVFTNAARRREAAARQAAQQLADSEAIARQEAERTAEEKRQLLYVSDMNVALQEWTLGNVEEVVDLLKRHQPLLDEQDLRGFEWYHLWNLCKPALQAPTLKHGTWIHSVAFSPDGKKLVSAGSLWLRIWDVESRSEDHVILGATSDHYKDIYDVSFSPDGKWVASANHGTTVRIWEVQSGKRKTELTLEHEEPVWSVAFSPDGERIASGSGRGVVTLWDAETAQRRHTLLVDEIDPSSDPWRSTAIAFSPDSTLLASGTTARTVRLWDVESGQVAASLAIKSRVVSLAFSPDKTLVAIRSMDEVMLWDWATGTRQPLTADAGTGVMTFGGNVAFSRSGKVMAVGGKPNVVKLWNVQTNEELATIVGHDERVESVAFSDEYLASGGWDGNVKLWGLPIANDRKAFLSGHSNSVVNVTFSSDGALLASTGGDVKLWSTETWSLEHTISARGQGVAFSPDSSTLAYFYGDAVSLWDVAAHQERASLPIEGSWSLAFSPDDSYVASATEAGAIHIWDLEAQEARELPGHQGPARIAAFSPDGAVLASGGGDSIVRLWDLETFTLKHELPVPNPEVRALAFLDGRTLASGTTSGAISLWDVETGKEVSKLFENIGYVHNLTLSHDNRTLAAAVGQVVILWDVKRKQERARLRTRSEIWSAAFSPDDRTLVAGLEDGSIKLWHAADPEEVQRAGW